MSYFAFYNCFVQSLKQSSYLFDQFPNFYIYLCTILFRFESVVGILSLFRFLIPPSTLPFFRIKSDNDNSL
jgi:hypothetical protein